MLRYVIAVIGVLFGVFVYYAFQPTTTSFTIQYTIYQNSSDIFYFVRNPYMLLDTCYSVKFVNITGCHVVVENDIEHCQVSVIQDFVHVGQQTVHISISSYANNLTIHSQMLIFHGVIAADWTYTFKSNEHKDSERKHGTLISVLCSVTSPHLIHKYANRTVYETHLAILSNIESAMLLSVSTSEYDLDM